MAAESPVSIAGGWRVCAGLGDLLFGARLGRLGSWRFWGVRTQCEGIFPLSVDVPQLMVIDGPLSWPASDDVAFTAEWLPSLSDLFRCRCLAPVPVDASLWILSGGVTPLVLFFSLATMPALPIFGGCGVPK